MSTVYLAASRPAAPAAISGAAWGRLRAAVLPPQQLRQLGDEATPEWIAVVET